MNKNQLRLTAGVLLLAGGLLSVSARATTLTLAPFDASGNTTFGLTHPATGAYVDDFLFSISAAMIGHASGTAVVGATWTLPNPVDNYAISKVQFFIVNPDSSHSDVSTVFNPVTLRFRADGPLAAGDYGFEVTGMTTIANKGGAYCRHTQCDDHPGAGASQLGPAVGPVWACWPWRAADASRASSTEPSLSQTQ